MLLQDLGSETSVTVDGKEVSKDQEVKLRVGSEISFGSSTVYKVRTPQARREHCVNSEAADICQTCFPIVWDRRMPCMSSLAGPANLWPTSSLL